MLSHDQAGPVLCMCCRAPLGEALCLTIAAEASVEMVTEVVARRIRGAMERALREELELMMFQ